MQQVFVQFLIFPGKSPLENGFRIVLAPVVCYNDKKIYEGGFILPEVCLARCRSYEPEEVTHALWEVLAPLGGLDWVTPGMTVVIKANLVALKSPDAAATTHPSLLAALTRELVFRGAKVIVGDSPGGLYNDFAVGRVYKAAGLSAVTEAGGSLNRNFEEAEADFPEGTVLRQFPYTAYLDEADALINFCKLKSHGMMAMSAAVKNMFGIVPGTIKPEYHYRFPDPMDFARMLVDLNRRFPPTLCLMDAVVGMEGNGPTAGTPKHIGALLAAKDPYKLDLAAARLIGLTKENVPTLLASRELSLIPETAEELSVNLPLADFIVPDFKNIPNLGDLWEQDGSAALWGVFSSRVIKQLMGSRPLLSPALCVGCEECRKVCPADAITMVKHKPRIDRKKCIRCFCCQEFCPKGALQVHRPPVARLLSREKKKTAE